MYSEKKYLILIKGEDKTKEIDKIQYLKGMYNVTFKDGGTYKYGYNNVEKLYGPKVKDVRNMEIKISGKYIYNVYQILYFDKYARLLFNDRSSKVCYKFEITIIKKTYQNYKSKDVFRYIKEISSILKIDDEDDESFLSEQFKLITEINDKSILYKYIKKDKNITSNEYINNIIFPFGFNISQEEATRKALNNKLSIIEGPPGTGKTQTILNIIANAIIFNKTIAVVSNNNSATLNVQEKLEDYGLSFISAFLGSKENKENFIYSQSGKYPDMKSWKIKSNELNSINYNLKRYLRKILILNEKTNLKAKIKIKLNEIIKEYSHYKMSNSYIKERLDKILSNKSADYILDLIDEINQYKKNTLFYRFIFYLKFKIKFNNIIYNENINKTIEQLNHIFYLKSIDEYEKQIKNLDKFLQNSDFEKEIIKYQELSMRYFKAKLYKKYGDRTLRKVFKKSDLYLKLSGFLKEYPVILSTTHSLRSISRTENMYDFVVIDESSQVDIVSGSLALSVAKNAVIVGDSMQLPHVVKSEVKKTTDKIFDKYDIQSCYKYTNSLLNSIKLLYKQNISSTLLKEHYRCNPNIIEFCNKKFYNSELIIYTNNDDPEPLSVYISPKGNHARGRFNQRQIDIITQEVLPNIDQNLSVGIITPFREQANKLIQKFHNTNIEADTVHKYQGRERDVIIISTVSNSIEANSFADNKNLINVAISRAKKKLVLVTSNDMLENKRTNISDLVSYIKYNNYDVQESNVLSVFDALYKKQSDRILDKFKNPKKITEFKSENIIYELLLDILEEDKYSSLTFLLHYPLRKLIKDYNLLTKEEKRYTSNYLTHVDFLIYNKLSKQPVLVIEVDGYAFHDKNEIQLKRDKIKDIILKKYGIKILRLNTTGSNERDKIINMLQNI